MDYKNQNVTPPPYYYNNGGGYDQSAAIASQTNAVMKRVYVRMFLGLLVSAFCALGVASSESLLGFFIVNRFIYWGMFIAMIAMAWILPSRMHKMSTGSVIGCFILFAALMGASLAPIFLIYQLGTIVSTFFITAGTFGAMSVFGYFTKSDLTKIGSFLFMALIGLIIATVVNIFVASSALDWVISIAGVLIFVGLTAWDTQQIKRIAAANLEPSLADKLATIGALNLYLDFINLFLYLLRFIGLSRD